MFRIRPFAGPDDFAGMAALLSSTSSETVTVAEVLDQEAKALGFIRRIVAYDEYGRMVGYASAQSWSMDAIISVVTRQDVREKGLGSRLLADVEESALRSGVIRLLGEVGDNESLGIHFAQRRGYSICRRTVESQLDLTDISCSSTEDSLSRFETEGIRLFTLADKLGSESLERSLYELYIQTQSDVPGAPRIPERFEQWRSMVFDGAHFRPALVLIAAHQDRLVGMKVIADLTPHLGGWYSLYTGVHRNYRGKGIAFALGQKMVRAAQLAGVKLIRTHNDSENAAMLAVNRRLGFNYLGGTVLMEKVSEQY